MQSSVSKTRASDQDSPCNIINIFVKAMQIYDTREISLSILIMNIKCSFGHYFYWYNIFNAFPGTIAFFTCYLQNSASD